LVYSLASRLTNQRCGLLAAFLYAINPISFLFIGQALTEIVSAFLITCTFLVFTIALTADQRRLLLLGATGLVSALCILCKPNVIWLPLVLAFSLICQHQRLSRRAFNEASILLAAALVVLLPWLVRNRLVYGGWFLSLAFDDNLAHVSAVATFFEAQNEEVAPWTQRWEEVYTSQIVAPTSNAYGWTERASLSERHEAVRQQREMATTARDLIRQYPSAFLVSHLKGVMRSFVPSVHRYWYAYVRKKPWPEKEALRTILEEAWSRTGNGQWHTGLQLVGAWWSRHPPLAQGLWLASAIVQTLGYVLVTVGMWRLRNRPGALVGAALILLCLALLPGPIAYIRFWVPGVPLAVTLIGVAFCRSECTNRSGAESRGLSSRA
jgi:4-amino-4-deoxy-L-arabinose transferase-like glycosyltransferase